ncbi:MAG: type II toxin-antitoxin system VapC family toxin [archaeon GB-1867-035]|nr:type II toxin-antitoxin system VapC family toxin [Candidatus Culexmicrobium profundum]
MVENPIYIDTNIFVYWLGKHPILGEVAYKWIKRIEESPRGRYVTSSLTLYEVLVIIAGLIGRSLKDKALIKEVINSIINLKGLVIEPLKSEDFIRALNLMEKYNLDYEDALHLSVAIRVDAKEIISNDEDFDKTPLKRTI